MSDEASIPASGRFMIALHPGEVLRELYLEPLGLSVTDAAAALNMPQQHLLEILGGDRAVTPDTTRRLETAFGASARSWLTCSANSDLEQESRHAAMSKAKRLNPFDDS